MSGVFAYIVYAAIFIAVVLAIEGVWLVARSVSRQSREINRRLGLIAAKQDPKAALSLMKESEGGPLSRAITRRAPWLGQLIWMSRVTLSPVTLLCVAAGMSALFILLFSAFGAPFLLSLVF